MKKLVLTAALLATATSSFAMGDTLFDQKNPAHIVTPAAGYEIEVATPETVEALEELGVTLERVYEVHKDLVYRHERGERLTDRQHRYAEHDVNHEFLRVLDRNLTNRVEFFKRAHNWNGDNKYEHNANYQVFLNKHNKHAKEAVNGYSNSYGWNVLRAVLQDALDNVKAVFDEKGEDTRGEDIVVAMKQAAEKNALTVNSEELRFYINELVWYTAKQTAKETNKELDHVLK